MPVYEVYSIQVFAFNIVHDDALYPIYACSKTEVYVCMFVQKLAVHAGIHMAELFRKALANKQDILVDKIVVEDGLWTKLQAKSILSGRQLRTCETKVCSS